MPLSRPRIALPLSRSPTPRRAARLRALVAALLLAASFARAQWLADADALIKPGHSAEAAQTYDRAARQGDAEAQLSVAVMYLAGIGGNHDEQASMDRLRLADGRDRAAAPCLRGMAKDGARWQACYPKSAAQGNAKARVALAHTGTSP